MVLGQMAIIPYPTLSKCRNVLKERKTTKITSSINQRIKRIKHFWLFWFFKLRHWSFYNSECWFVCWSVEKNSISNNKKIKELWLFWLFDYLRYLRPTVTGVSEETQNQRVKRIKRILIFFIFWLIISYFIEGQGKTDKDNRMSSHMTKIPFPVLYQCRNALKRAKTTMIKCKNN